MPPHRNLDVLDAADLVADEIEEILASAARLIHLDQLRRSSESIGSNIREGMGRGPGRDRAQFLRTARASAEETIGHLRRNVAARLISPKTYWRLHNRIVAITKMLNALLRHPTSGPPATEYPPRKRRARTRRGTQRRRGSPNSPRGDSVAEPPVVSGRRS